MRILKYEGHTATKVWSPGSLISKTEFLTTTLKKKKKTIRIIMRETNLSVDNDIIVCWKFNRNHELFSRAT